MTGTKQRWDEPEEDHLLFLRDVEQLGFALIAKRLGRTSGACQVRYYGRLYGRNGAKHYGVFHPLAREAELSVAEPAPLRAVARPPSPMPPARPCVRDQRPVNLDGLRDWNELRARIAERGLTGGVFGDPRPGESALDKRAGAAAAAVQPTLARGGSDVG